VPKNIFFQVIDFINYFFLTYAMLRQRPPLAAKFRVSGSISGVVGSHVAM
jgi:hypothetical protein